MAETSVDVLPASFAADVSLALDVRTLAELLIERMNLAVGTTRLELSAEDGRLTSVWRHERIGATKLAERGYAGGGADGSTEQGSQC